MPLANAALILRAIPRSSAWTISRRSSELNPSRSPNVPDRDLLGARLMASDRGAAQPTLVDRHLFRAEIWLRIRDTPCCGALCQWCTESTTDCASARGMV